MAITEVEIEVLLGAKYFVHSLSLSSRREVQAGIYISLLHRDLQSCTLLCRSPSRPHVRIGDVVCGGRCRSAVALDNHVRLEPKLSI